MTKISNQYSLTNILTADLANSRLGINNVSPAYSLDVTGTARVSTSAYFATASGSVGIGTTSPSDKLSVIGSSGVDGFIFVSGGSGTTLGGLKFGNTTNTYGRLFFDNATNDVTLFQQYLSGNLIFGTNTTERMRILSNGNVGIGYSAPTNLLQVNGTGYFNSNLSSGGNISAAGTLSSANLSTTSVLYAANLAQFSYNGSLALTVPNALNSGSSTADIRMYMIWVTGFGDALHAGARIWLMIMNGNGTDYSAVELLGRDTAGGTGLSISRSAVNQITISSNGYGFIKSVSCMQLITN